MSIKAGAPAPIERLFRGDVLFFHRPTSWATLKADPLGTLMTALIHAVTGSRWNHVAIAYGPHSYIEATAQGVKRSWLSDGETDEILVVRPGYADAEDAWSAVSWAYARVGFPYSYWNAFMCGLNRVLSTWHVAIKTTDAIICSELVAEALERAGYDFGKDSSQVSPGDLATALGIAR